MLALKKLLVNETHGTLIARKNPPDFCTLVLTAYMFKMKIQMLEYCTVLTFSLLCSIGATVFYDPRALGEMCRGP